MSGQASAAFSRRVGQRLAWALAASTLVLTLALGGCQSGAHHASQGNQTTQQQASGTTTGSSSTGANSAALQQLQTIDNQNQSDAQQLSGAQSAAGLNYASQDNQTQP